MKLNKVNSDFYSGQRSAWNYILPYLLYSVYIYIYIYIYLLGMHDIWFQYADIFQLILADSRYNIFPIVWKPHQVSPVQKLQANYFQFCLVFNKNLFARIK